jgi:hypothetical protein
VSSVPDSKNADTMTIDGRASASEGSVERNDRAAIGRFEHLGASELRTIAPEEIQILAATGC